MKVYLKVEYILDLITYMNITLIVMMMMIIITITTTNFMEQNPLLRT